MTGRRRLDPLAVLRSSTAHAGALLLRRARVDAALLVVLVAVVVLASAAAALAPGVLRGVVDAGARDAAQRAGSETDVLVETPVGQPGPGRSVITPQAALELTRSVPAGLPAPLPDVHGLALRVLLPDGPGDVLMNTAGFGRWTRYALVPTRSAYARPLSTLIPYRTVAGPVLIGAREVGPDRLELTCAVDGGPFRVFGEVALGPRHEDQDVSFDVVTHTLPGLEQYDAVRRLRAPSYAAARASRREG